MALDFEWDLQKSRANRGKHGISFEEAATVLADPLSLTIADPAHSSSREERFVTVGRSARQHTLVVVHTDRGNRIRVISARKATARERRDYEQGNQT